MLRFPGAQINHANSLSTGVAIPETTQQENQDCS